MTIYSGWFGLTLGYDALPWWGVLIGGGWLIAWHGSLQHEAIHGHPTRSDRLNALLAGWPLWLWLPYGIYRESHISHHRSGLTDPIDDPESFYFTPEVWRRLDPIRRGILWAHQTAVGRLLLGPLVATARFLASEARLLRAGDGSHLRHWALHAVQSALILYWVLAVCGIPLWAYLLLFVYPGLSLTLLRSFAEHRPAVVVEERTVIVESLPFGLLFLNNNLHAVHHDEPRLAWYRLPSTYRARRDEVLTRNGGYRFRGYLQVCWRYLVRPKDAPVYPELVSPTT